MKAVSLAGGVLAAIAMLAGEDVMAAPAGRFLPASADVVVLKVPARAANDPIAVLEMQRARSPDDEATAAALAQLYLERARTDRQQRYFARAESLVQPWVQRREAQPATLRVQADILQNRHDFSGSMTLLNRAIEQSPHDASARLLRASVNLVQGRAVDARPDCAAVMTAGETLAGTVCLAQVLGMTGGLQRSSALLDALLARDRDALQAAPTRSWAYWLRADLADRGGEPASAERFLREALRQSPANEGVRSALSDLLLARGAYREALSVVDLAEPSVGLLARRARAEKLLSEPQLAETRARIDELLTLERRRADTPHLREEAFIALDVDGDCHRALTLARANFAVQRETLDVRLLARAARQCGDLAALSDVASWVRTTGYEDHALATISSNPVEKS